MSESKQKTLHGMQMEGYAALKVYDMGSKGYPEMDPEKIAKILGPLTTGDWFPYGDDSKTGMIMLVDRKHETLVEAVRRLNAAGYETDEDDAAKW